MANGIQTLAGVVSLDVIAKDILPMMETLTRDDIPNIRFNVAKTYAALIGALRRLPEQGTIYTLEQSKTPFSPSPRGQQLIDERVMPSLEKLQKDDDVDVRYFATTAAAAATGAPVGGGEPMNTSP
jgi:serine/threonine-protein phosphatase 2A regulatory subunit A